MPQDNNEKVQNHLVGTVYAGTASTDLTTNVNRRINDKTQPEHTARVKEIVTDAGGAN